MVNAVYGFASMLLKVIHDLRPAYLAVSFDVAGKTFRDDLYDKYKATRVKSDQSLYDQIPLVYEVVEAFGIPIYAKQGFEADDVIGTVMQKLKKHKPAIPALIVTGDMDMLQLVDDTVRVYELRKGLSDIVIFDAKKVAERFGFGPERVVDYKALRGDTSDNIPGIKGIGEKTASELIQKYGGIDDIYAHFSHIEKDLKPSVRKKLADGEKDARMSKALATIKRDVPDVAFSLSECEWKNVDRARVVALFQKFDFPSLLKRLPGAPADAAAPAKKKEKKSSRRHGSAVVPVNGQNAEDFFSAIAAADRLCVKELSTHPDILKGSLTGFVIVAGGVAYAALLERLDAPSTARLFDFFLHTEALIVGHDLKLFIKALFARGVPARPRLFDVMIASYLLNSSTRAHDMKSIVLRELGKELPGASDQTSLFGADAVAVAEELRCVDEVYGIYAKALEDREDAGLFDKVEMRLIPVLADMELNGVAIDAKLLGTLSADIAKDLDRVTKRIWKEAGMEFNVASSVQLRDVLFETMHLPTEGVKKGKTGYSTAASELEKLRGIHPIIEMIEEHRELAKLQNTYVDVLPTLINPATGRVHTTFNQAVTSTGRLSSSDPNLQNIPIRTPLGKKIRDAFVAEEGHILITADYSQIELRIVASLANDEKMIKIFDEGKDIHRATAAAINGVPEDSVTKEMRSAAKEVNFGVLYGMGAYGLAWRAGIPQAEAQDFIRKYFEQFSGVKAYIDQTIQFARKEGYVETLFGRRRYIPELTADNFQVRSSGERMAVNMPIQGTAADVMKMAMINVEEKLRGKKGVRIILQVHDELVLEVDRGTEKEISAIVKAEMEGVAALRVPVEVHVSSGKRWGELK
jgi:DNA polymerase-1